jgi:hypothetical protein
LLFVVVVALGASALPACECALLIILMAAEQEAARELIF